MSLKKKEYNEINDIVILDKAQKWSGLVMGDRMKMASIRLHYIVVNKKPPPQKEWSN